MPDVEKIIIMSDYFNVTTDYILKGIEVVENKEEKSKEIVGKVLYIASTALIVYIPFYNVPIDVDMNFDPNPILWTLENTLIPIRGHQTVPLL